MAPPTTTVVISSPRQLDSKEKLMVDDLLRALRHHNQRKPYDEALFPEDNSQELILMKMSKSSFENIPVSAANRSLFWNAAFAGGWNTDKPNPRPPAIRDQALGEVSLLFGKITRDASPIDIDDLGMKTHFARDQDGAIAGTFEGGATDIIFPKDKETKKDDETTDPEAADTVPAHRRAGQPAFVKAFLDWPDNGIWYFWVDKEGGHLQPADVALVRNMDLEDAKDKVRAHYDRNEMSRVGQWNGELVIWWIRERLISMAGSKSAGRTFNAKAHAKNENLKELQQIRTCQAEVEYETPPALDLRLAAYNAKHGLPILPAKATVDPINFVQR